LPIATKLKNLISAAYKDIDIAKIIKNEFIVKLSASYRQPFISPIYLTYLSHLFISPIYLTYLSHLFISPIYLTYLSSFTHYAKISARAVSGYSLLRIAYYMFARL